jgi:hypothetical protein
VSCPYLVQQGRGKIAYRSFSKCGLDSANAIEFCKTLRLATKIVGSAAVVAIYQAPQSAYDVSKTR